MKPGPTPTFEQKWMLALRLQKRLIILAKVKRLASSGTLKRTDLESRELDLNVVYAGATVREYPGSLPLIA